LYADIYFRNTQMNDFVELLKTFSFPRLLNLVKSFLGYHISRMLGRPYGVAFPLSFSIEPTTACNLRCPECPSGLRSFSRATGNLQPETFRKALDLLSPHAFAVTLYFQGEPFINKHFFDLVKMAVSSKLYTITSTNGHFLDDDNCEKIIQSGLDRIIISVDGLTQETYQKYRIEGRLNKVIEGMKRLSSLKQKQASNKPQIVAQFIAFKHNEHELKNVHAFLLSHGADRIQVKTAQVYNEQNAENLLPDDPSLSRYELDAQGKLKIRNKLLNQCWRMWSSCVITWDGNVVPCCFDKDASHKVGNINEVTDFKEIMHSEAYTQFRKSLLHSRKEIDICKNCSEGTKVFA